jgi:proton-translocating NADH-quinone oxidoreductase chain N
MVSPVLLIVVPLGLAFIILLFASVSTRGVKYIPVVGMVFNLVVSLLLIRHALDGPIVVTIGGFPPPFGINLVTGSLGLMFSVLIAVVGLIVSIYALGYVREGATERYHALYLLLLAGATGAVLTGDIFNLFVFYEILCISSYALVAYLGERDGIEAAVKYLIQGSVGSGFVLIGIAILYGLFGTLNMADMAQHIDSANPLYLFVPLVFLITGFGVEAAVFPLNAWLPDAHASAPSSISAILSGIAIKVGVYAVARVVFTLYDASGMFVFLVLLGLVTLLIAEISAFSQNNIKRMLAYSSIGQIGLIVFAFGLASQAGISGGLFQLTSHAFAKSLLFLTVGYMIYRAGSMEISALAGMGERMPLTCVAFTIGAFSLVGMPPFIGFASKLLIVNAALAQQNVWFTVLMALALTGTVVEAAYFFRVVQVLYFEKPAMLLDVDNIGNKGCEAPLTALVPICGLVILILFLGIYPNVLTGLLNAAASELLERAVYITGVLG